MVNDPIADMLTQIKNASMAHKKTVVLPYSKMKYSVAKILSEEGYIGQIDVIENEKSKKLSIIMKYLDKQSVIRDVKRISKPGLRSYVNKRAIPRVVNGMGLAILSTPQGVISGDEARKRGIGGEIICTIW